MDQATQGNAPREKISIKALGWGWIKRFQIAQLKLIRVSERLKEDILDSDDEVYEATVAAMEAATARIQELLCKVIISVPQSLIVDAGGYDPNDPVTLDNVDQLAVAELMQALQKRVTSQQTIEADSKN